MSNDTRNITLVILSGFLSIVISLWLWSGLLGSDGVTRSTAAASPSLASPARMAAVTVSAARTNEQADASSSSGDATPAPVTPRPRITTAWLVGRWALAKTNDCNEEGAIAYFANGTFGQEEGGGKFKTNGTRITYYDFFEWGDSLKGGGEVPTSDPPNIQPAVAIDQNRVRIGGDAYARCADSRRPG